MNDQLHFEQQATRFRDRYTAVKDEVGKVIVGHDEIVHGVRRCQKFWIWISIASNLHPT